MSDVDSSVVDLAVSAALEQSCADALAALHCSEGDTSDDDAAPPAPPLSRALTRIGSDQTATEFLQLVAESENLGEVSVPETPTPPKSKPKLLVGIDPGMDNVGVAVTELEYVDADAEGAPARLIWRIDPARLRTHSARQYMPQRRGAENEHDTNVYYLTEAYSIMLRKLFPKRELSNQVLLIEEAYYNPKQAYVTYTLGVQHAVLSSAARCLFGCQVLQVNPKKVKQVLRLNYPQIWDKAKGTAAYTKNKNFAVDVVRQGVLPNTSAAHNIRFDHHAADALLLCYVWVRNLNMPFSIEVGPISSE